MSGSVYDALGSAFLAGGCALVFLAEDPDLLESFNAWCQENSPGAFVTAHEAMMLANTLWHAEKAVPS